MKIEIRPAFDEAVMKAELPVLVSFFTDCSVFLLAREHSDIFPEKEHP